MPEALSKFIAIELLIHPINTSMSINGKLYVYIHYDYRY